MSEDSYFDFKPERTSTQILDLDEIYYSNDEANDDVFLDAGHFCSVCRDNTAGDLKRCVWMPDVSGVASQTSIMEIPQQSALKRSYNILESFDCDSSTPPLKRRAISSDDSDWRVSSLSTPSPPSPHYSFAPEIGQEFGPTSPDPFLVNPVPVLPSGNLSSIAIHEGLVTFANFAKHPVAKYFSLDWYSVPGSNALILIPTNSDFISINDLHKSDLHFTFNGN